MGHGLWYGIKFLFSGALLDCRYNNRYGVEQKIYFRFNVQHGLEQVALEEWKEMDRTKVATQEYTGGQWSQIQACASQLRNPTGR